MGYTIRYDAAGGGHVDVSFPLDPYEVLEVPHTASQVDTKIAFFYKISQTSRQKRAMVSIANHILTSTVGKYKREPGNKFSFSPILNPSPLILKAASTLSAIFGNHFMLAAAGHTERLARRIDNNANIVNEVDEHGRTLLYLACKSGFYDTSKLLLTRGAPVNETQRDGSTPLHVAAYYGHAIVVGLLLEHGASTKIKNNWGKTALDESRSDEIDKLIQSASKNCITSLIAQLMEKGLISSVRPIEYQEKVIAKELVRDPTSALDESTQADWDDITESWEPVWHGTRFEYLPSILEKGLLPSGSGDIKPSKGHYALGEEILGVENWAAAIFVSPSIKYAGHVCYSERVLSESKQWCVLVKAFCEPGSYKSYQPTVIFDSKPIDGEPVNPEYRVPVSDEDRDAIFRVESSRKVVVRSVVFVRLRFLENEKIDFEEATKIFA